MYTINISGLKMLAKAGAPVTIRLVPSASEKYSGRYFMTMTAKQINDEVHEAGVLVTTKGGEDIRYYKDVSRAIKEVGRILVNLEDVSILTDKGGESYQAEQGTRY